MRVFVTGGSGFIGSAVVRDLIAAGHSVVGLARSKASAAALEAVGAEPHPGSLEDLASLRAAAARTDGVIHTAFDNSSLLRFPWNSRIERSALRAIADVIAGSDRPLVVAGGFASVIRTGTTLTENDMSSSGAGPVGRNVERTARELADGGVNASVVRLPCVHGTGDRFTIPRYIDIARKTGVSGYVGDGGNRWPAVHNVDAARVFRLALEQGLAGARYHAVAEEGVPFKNIAEVIGRRLGVPVVGMAPRAARKHFGLYSSLAQGDAPASSALTRERLGWHPEGPSVIADIDRPEYYDPQAS
jgi:nucleoside-diphosphate-sugar epimerase